MFGYRAVNVELATDSNRCLRWKDFVGGHIALYGAFGNYQSLAIVKAHSNFKCVTSSSSTNFETAL